MFEHCSQEIIDVIRSRDHAAELESMISWVRKHEKALSDYIPDEKSDHIVLFWSSIMQEVEGAIDQKDPRAITISLAFIFEDPKTPFGKIHKRRVLKRLRRVSDCLDPSIGQQLADKIKKLENSPYPPQELNDYIRLYHRVNAGVAGEMSGD